MKKILLFILAFGFACIANAQNVNVPDTNFKTYLLGNAYINTNGDNEIQISEAAAFTGQISVNGLNISSLTGIEAFTLLTYLSCTNNQLVTINLSSNTDLLRLYCENNQLAGLSISSNTKLIELSCGNNQLTSLDVSANSDIVYIECSYNQFTELDMSANTVLNELYCNNNQLTSLNIKNGNNINFTFFNATNNPNLTCIQVDNVAYSNANWSMGKDVSASFSENCLTGMSSFSSEQNLFYIFPNPNEGKFQLAIDNSQLAKTEIEIYNVLGEVVYTSPLPLSIWRGVSEGRGEVIDLSKHGNGIYFIQISFENGIVNKKVIVE